MRKSILFSIFIFQVLILNAQKGYVEYGYIESLALGNAQGIDYNAVLLFDKMNSYYVSQKEDLEKPEKIGASKIVEDGAGEVKAVFNGMGVSKEGNQVFFSLANKSMASILFFKKSIQIDDGLVQIDWIISTETKKIGTFACTKATANFRGRNYTAWFTTAVPVPYGPWKLNGLPGLIVEAYDTDKYVYWYFKNLTYPSTRNEELKTNASLDVHRAVTYSNFKTIQHNEIQKRIEKNAILMKDIPDVTITSPNKKDLFLECE